MLNDHLLLPLTVVLGGSISALDFFNAYPPSVLSWLLAAFPVNESDGGNGSIASEHRLQVVATPTS